jgi:hypothetical protein
MTQCPECSAELHLDYGVGFAEFLKHREDVMVEHCAEFPDEHSILMQKFVDALLADVPGIENPSL